MHLHFAIFALPHSQSARVGIHEEFRRMVVASILKEQKGSTIKIQAPPVKQTLISGIKAGDFGSSVYNGYVYCDLFFEVISNTLIDATVSHKSPSVGRRRLFQHEWIELGQGSLHHRLHP